MRRQAPTGSCTWLTERWEATQHDVQDDAHRPNVASAVVPDVLQHFGCHILRCSTASHHELLSLLVLGQLRHDFREAEVGNFDRSWVTRVRKEQILWLQIAVGDATRVQLGNSVHDLAA